MGSKRRAPRGSNPGTEAMLHVKHARTARTLGELLHVKQSELEALSGVALKGILHRSQGLLDFIGMALRHQDL